MRDWSSWRSTALKTTPVIGLTLLLTAGCSRQDGPELGTVAGIVTLDGQPLEDAEVTFQPDSARPSYGLTDNAGKYFLQFTADRKGAAVGNHTVSITTKRSQSGGEGNEPLVPARKELLPPKYHSSTELTRVVNKGANTIDFELLSAK